MNTTISTERYEELVEKEIVLKILRRKIESTSKMDFTLLDAKELLPIINLAGKEEVSE